MVPFFKKAFNTAKKIVIVGSVYFLILFLFSAFTSPEKTSSNSSLPKYDQTTQDIYQTLKDPELNATVEGKMSLVLYRMTLCGLIGEACTDDPKDADKNFTNSLFGGAANLIAMPYKSPPASGIIWARNGLENIGFVPKSYAATGVGFSGLAPIQDLWKIFRNFSYLLLVLVIIAIGFMIMFRTKVNPQTIISIENALPRIVISLILITFSFAIAGFLVDIMYITIVSGISIVSQVNIANITATDMAKLQNQYIGASLSDLWLGKGTALDVGSAIVEILPRILKDILKGSVALATAFFVTKLVIFPLEKLKEGFEGISISIGGQALTFGGEAGVGVGKFISHFTNLPMFFLLFAFLFPHMAGFVIAILFSITLLFFMFRIFFMLLTSYIKILLFTIFAPVILLFVAIPGRPAFSWWFKNLLAELATFPIVIILIIVGRVITHVSLEDKLLRPPFLFNIDPSPFSTLLGIGLILMIPGLVKSAKQALGAKGIGGLGAGTFFAGVGALAGGAGGLAQKYYYASHLPGLGGENGLLSRLGGKMKDQYSSARKRVSAPRPVNPTSPQPSE